ncbi:ArdC family protein [Pedobacter sp. Leaf132]|uniref:ArdC family protein n=1 Tax=Pedobacter sp. Leaf132 TaxID=2876557 RepID=UPI001E3FC43A|nr:zincin-like metallopeptidase domain-containing protein [Pedobacter sp. Leaf132]
MITKNIPLHQQVADLLIEQLQKGTAPWQKPWKGGDLAGFELPYNVISSNRYRGINVMNLLLKGYEDPRWLTFKQAESIDATINRGEKGTLIQYVKTHQQKSLRDDKGKILFDDLGQPLIQKLPLDRPLVCSAWVFNAQQVSGLPALKRIEPSENQWDPLGRAEALISASGADISHRHIDAAFYDVRYDNITLPERSKFSSADNYYATALHELAHWTGHPSRLDRASLMTSGMIPYAKEELRAEIASMIIGAEVGIGHDPAQHASYVDSWVSILTDTPMEIHSAAADAEKIFDFLMAIERKRVLETSATPELPIAPEKQLKFLSTGDEILYNDNIYKVEGHLKQGRLRMSQMPSGIQFSLSSADPLYAALLAEKLSQSSGVSLIIPPAKAAPEYNIFQNLKR